MYRTGLLAATLVLALLAPSGREAARHGSTPDVVFEWNQILQDTIPGAGAVGAARFYGMTHIAMFDAVNAIEREFEPYRVRLAAPEQRIASRCRGAGSARRARGAEPACDFRV